MVDTDGLPTAWVAVAKRALEVAAADLNVTTSPLKFFRVAYERGRAPSFTGSPRLTRKMVLDGSMIFVRYPAAPRDLVDTVAHELAYIAGRDQADAYSFGEQFAELHVSRIAQEVS